MFTKSLGCLAVAIAVVLGTSLDCQAISANFSNPTKGQAYGKGSSISYSGSGDWGATEGTCSSVITELRFDNPDTGAIVDSETSTFSANAVNRTFSFSNLVPETLTANQYQTNQSTYYLCATPYTASGPYIVKGSGKTFRGSVELGTIK